MLPHSTANNLFSWTMYPNDISGSVKIGDFSFQKIINLIVFHNISVIVYVEIKIMICPCINKLQKYNHQM